MERHHRMTEPAPISAEQAAFLQEQRSGRLATVDPPASRTPSRFATPSLTDGSTRPSTRSRSAAIPVSYGASATSWRTRRSASSWTTTRTTDWSRLGWLQVRGVASLVEDEAERAHALAALRARYRQYQTMALESLPLLRITPTRLVGWQR